MSRAAAFGDARAGSDEPEPEAAGTDQPDPDRLVQAALGYARNVVELGAAEGRLAGLSALSIMLATLVVCVSVLIAWALGAATLVIVAQNAGVPLSLATLLLAVAHAALVMLLLLRIRRLSANLTLPRVRRQLTDLEGR